MTLTEQHSDIPKRTLSQLSQELEFPDIGAPAEPRIALVVPLEGCCDHFSVLFVLYKGTDMRFGSNSISTEGPSALATAGTVCDGGGQCDEQ